MVQAAQVYLDGRIGAGDLVIPEGVSYTFAGSYENQIRSEARMRIILPLALFLIFMILYMQFKRASTSFIVFTGIFVSWAGGFLMVWLYSQDWFLNFSILGTNLRDLFQMGQVNLSVAVWVGFLALFPVLTSHGRGADIMIPMAIPSFGGMVLAVMTVFIAPMLYAWIEERKLANGNNGGGSADEATD